ncbi:MAG: phosphoenolpyruvate synthase, partial [Gemmatimonadota bacterium]
MRWIKWFSDLSIDDVPLVGGKNASLGEMRRELSALGVPVPDGFAVTAEAFREFVRRNELAERITTLLAERAKDDVAALERSSATLRELVMSAPMPNEIAVELAAAYNELCTRSASPALEVAVRSSATAEDLPTASFAGAHETLLNVSGEAELVEAVRRCFASLYNARAIRYREDMGFKHEEVALSVGVQQMLAADASVAGVIFTLDTETGFRDVILIDAIYGLGENIVQGRVGPDEYTVHKPTLRAGKPSIVRRKLGKKELRLVFNRDTRAHEQREVPIEERNRFCLSDEQVLQLAKWALAIEDHYSEKLGRPTPMDIEFAKNGPGGPLCILQARPETVHSAKRRPTVKVYQVRERGRLIVEGLAVGDQIATGTARVIKDTSRLEDFRAGDVLVTDVTDPDWEPILKRSAAVVTARGGRTSHAAIVARELGIPAVVGASDALTVLADARRVTVSC